MALQSHKVFHKVPFRRLHKIHERKCKRLQESPRSFVKLNLGGLMKLAVGKDQGLYNAHSILQSSNRDYTKLI